MLSKNISSRLLGDLPRTFRGNLPRDLVSFRGGPSTDLPRTFRGVLSRALLWQPPGLGKEGDLDHPYHTFALWRVIWSTPITLLGALWAAFGKPLGAKWRQNDLPRCPSAAFRGNLPRTFRGNV